MKTIFPLIVALAMGGTANAQNSPITPVAVINGGFFTVSPAPDPSASNPMLGMFALDASASKSDGPIEWKVTGPTDLPLSVSTPAGNKPTNSLASAFVYTPGVYTFKVVATGTRADGKPTADAEVMTRTVPAPVAAPIVEPAKPPVFPVKPLKPEFTGRLWAILVLNLDDPSTTDLRVSTISADLLAMNCQWTFVRSLSDIGKKYTAAYPNDGVPIVYITDDAGNIKATVKPPTLADAVMVDGASVIPTYRQQVLYRVGLIRNPN